MIDGIRLREQVAQTAGEALIAISQEELDALCQAILDARRIFIAGWGRAGNVIRLLSMNCSQMGLKTHIVGDNSTPSIHEGDLLVIGSGSGNTDTMKILADQAKEHGAKLALVTSRSGSYIEQKADLTVHIPVKHSREDQYHQPIALSLVFYQATVMMVDCVMAYLMEEKGQTFKDVKYYHNNLE